MGVWMGEWDEEWDGVCEGDDEAVEKADGGGTKCFEYSTIALTRKSNKQAGTATVSICKQDVNDCSSTPSPSISPSPSASPSNSPSPSLPPPPLFLFLFLSLYYSLACLV